MDSTIKLTTKELLICLSGGAYSLAILYASWFFTGEWRVSILGVALLFFGLKVIGEKYKNEVVVVLLSIGVTGIAIAPFHDVLAIIGFSIFGLSFAPFTRFGISIHEKTIWNFHFKNNTNRTIPSHYQPLLKRGK